MIVMMMAITPSLNASSRLLPMDQNYPRSDRQARFQHTRALLVKAHAFTERADLAVHLLCQKSLQTGTRP
jgi:hypothetical protein